MFRLFESHEFLLESLKRGEYKAFEDLKIFFEDGGTLQTSRVLWAAASPLLREILYDNGDFECCVSLPGFHKSSFQKVLEVITRGYCIIKDDTELESSVTALAKFLEIGELDIKLESTNESKQDASNDPFSDSVSEMIYRTIQSPSFQNFNHGVEESVVESTIPDFFSPSLGVHQHGDDNSSSEKKTENQDYIGERTSSKDSVLSKVNFHFLRECKVVLNRIPWPPKKNECDGRMEGTEKKELRVEHRTWKLENMTYDDSNPSEEIIYRPKRKVGRPRKLQKPKGNEKEGENATKLNEIDRKRQEAPEGIISGPRRKSSRLRKPEGQEICKVGEPRTEHIGSYVKDEVPGNEDETKDGENAPWRKRRRQSARDGEHAKDKVEKRHDGQEAIKNEVHFSFNVPKKTFPLPKRTKGRPRKLDGQEAIKNEAHFSFNVPKKTVPLPKRKKGRPRKPDRKIVAITRKLITTELMKRRETNIAIPPKRYLRDQKLRRVRRDLNIDFDQLPQKNLHASRVPNLGYKEPLRRSTYFTKVSNPETTLTEHQNPHSMSLVSKVEMPIPSRDSSKMSTYFSKGSHPEPKWTYQNPHPSRPVSTSDISTPYKRETPSSSDNIASLSKCKIDLQKLRQTLPPGVVITRIRTSTNETSVNNNFVKKDQNKFSSSAPEEITSKPKKKNGRPREQNTEQNGSKDATIVIDLADSSPDVGDKTSPKQRKLNPKSSVSKLSKRGELGTRRKLRGAEVSHLKEFEANGDKQVSQLQMCKQPGNRNLKRSARNDFLQKQRSRKRLDWQIYTCECCGKTFRRKSNFNKHKQVAHSHSKNV